MIGQAARSVLYSVAFFEVIFPQTVEIFDKDLTVSNITFQLIQVVFVSNCLQIILSSLTGLFLNAKDMPPVFIFKFKKKQKIKSISKSNKASLSKKCRATISVAVHKST